MSSSSPMFPRYSNPALQYPPLKKKPIPDASSLRCGPLVAQAPKEGWCKSFFIDYLLGGVAATVDRTMTAPIERVKLLLQSQDEIVKAGRLSEPYKGIGDCFKKTLADEGILSFWRGNSLAVVRYFPTEILYLAFNDCFKKVLAYRKDQGYWKWFAANLASGGAAGAVTLSLMYPLDYARTRLANDVKVVSKGVDRQFDLFDIYRKTFASDGLRGLYRGFNISCVGIFVYRGLYFGLYDSLKPALLVDSLKDNFFARFFLGWLIASAVGLATYPIDTVRRRMMMTSCETFKYTSSIQCFSQIVKNEGPKSLFKGAGANLVRAVASGAVLAGYDKLQDYYLRNGGA